MTGELLELSETGKQILSKDGVYLHSRYAPEREAERFIQAHALNLVTVCILVCPGLDYLTQAIRTHVPGMKILCIQPSTWYRQHQGAAANCNWYPDSTQSTSEFIQENIDDTESTLCELLVWPPSQTVYEHFCKSTLSEIGNCLKAMSAGFRTQGFFGRRWIKNLLVNTICFKKLREKTFATLPVFLAASGPGLADALPLIVKFRSRFVLWALPSSIKALHSHQVVPDCVVTSDAGYWAGQHLLCIPDSWLDSVLIFAPARAMLRPLFARFSRVYTFSADSIFDALLSGSPHFVVPDRGTVSATAFELLVAFGCRDLFVAGLDFAYKDLWGHVRPHTFETMNEDEQARLRPRHSSLFEQLHAGGASAISQGWWKTTSLGIYQQWFEQANFSRALKVIDYSPSGLAKGLNPVDLTEFESALDCLSPISEIDKHTWISSYEMAKQEDGQRAAKELLRALKNALLNSESDRELFDAFCCHVAPIEYRNWRKARVHEAPGEISACLARMVHKSEACLRDLEVFANDFTTENAV